MASKADAYCHPDYVCRSDAMKVMETDGNFLSIRNFMNVVAIVNISFLISSFYSSLSRPRNVFE